MVSQAVLSAGPNKERGGFSTCLHRFDNVGEGTAAVSGIFAAGERPLWLVASRGCLVPHTMESDHHVASFHTFHNPNCLSVSTPHQFQCLNPKNP